MKKILLLILATMPLFCFAQKVDTKIDDFTAPQAKEMMPVTENTVYFLPNNDAEQAQIHLYIPMQKADKKDDVLRSAFNQYFGLDFQTFRLNHTYLRLHIIFS